MARHSTALKPNDPRRIQMEINEAKDDLSYTQNRLGELRKTRGILAIAGMIFVTIGLYGLAYYFGRENWMMLIITGFAGYVIYRCHEVFESYQNYLESRINDYEFTIRSNEKHISSDDENLSKEA